MARQKLTDPGDGGQTNKVGKGAYIKNVKIKSVEDKSSYPGLTTNYFKSGNQTQIYLILKIEDDGFERSLFLMGKFRYSNDKVTGWNNFNNDVQRLLYKTLGDEAEIDAEHFNIPADVLNKLIGKEIRVVSFITGRKYNNDSGEHYSWDFWTKVFGKDQPDEDIENEWNASIGWLISTEKYVPDNIDKVNASRESFNYGANQTNEADSGGGGEDII